MKRTFNSPLIGAIALLAASLDAQQAGIVVTTTQWDQLLQEDYVQGEIVEAIDTSTPFKDKLARKSMVGGRERNYPVKVGASQGQGARAENAAMPGYGGGEYKNVLVTAKYNYAPFKVTGQSLEFTTRAAFVEFGMQLLKDTKEGLGNFTGRQCWGDGSGKLALINNGAGYAAAAVTVIVDSAYGVLWGSLATNTTFLFKRNMFIQFNLENNGGAGYKITAITPTTITFTPGLANAIVDNAPIYTLGSKDLEIEGYLKMVASSAFMTGELALGTSTYHGIDRAAFPEWEGNVVNVGAALSLAVIRTLKDAIFKRTNEEGSNLCINSTEVTRDFEALLTPNQRYLPATKLETGVTSLEHDGLRWTKDAKAPVKSLNILRTDVINWAQTRDPHWLKDGNGIMRVVAGEDALEGLLKWYSNLDCTEPRRLGIGYNLTVV